MRALKTILIILGSLIALWLVLSLMGPKDSHLERSTVIKASPNTIFEYIRFLKNQDEWGVWYKMDPNAKYELVGEDGTVGAKRTWDGQVVRQGAQTIVALEQDKSVKADLEFGPMLGHGSLDLTPQGDSTKVSWSMRMEIPFIFRAAALFMANDEGARDFEGGLANLKTICEAKQVEMDKASVPTFAIAVSEWPAKLYVGKREVVKWDDMKAFFTKHFGENMATVTKAGVQPAGSPSGVFFEWSEKDRTADLIAGIPVPLDARSKLKGSDLYEMPASKVLSLDYYGGYSGTAGAHMAMDKYIQDNHLTHHTNVVEEYITDPGQEPDSTKWLTRITYLVK
ncbi:MAG: SRPBCC family protein [Bacteroidetes bacterium]|nr:SRPBCC family protein [Bacteroidota bacterium]HMU14211.1 SRPBCC family protein [Flavobacteriales bacterium]